MPLIQKILPQIDSIDSRKLFFPLLIIFSSLTLSLSSHFNYLLFHSLVELFSIVIALGIFAVAWTSRRYVENNFLLIIGIGYFFIGGFDLVHTLSYKGMGVFPDLDANLPTQLWVIARYMEAITFFGALLLLKKEKIHDPDEAKKKGDFIFLFYTLVSVALFLSVFQWKIFPAAYVEGSGLTEFKKISEYAVSLLFLASTFLLFKKNKALDPRMVNLISLSLIIKIVSELSFTEYAGVYDFSNMLGHIFKFISSLLIYKAVLEIGLLDPYRLLFFDLKESQREYQEAQNELQRRIKDHLTEAYEHLGVANRKISLLLEMDEHSRSKRNKKQIIEYIVDIAKSASHAKMAMLYRYEKNDNFSLIWAQEADQARRERLKNVSAEKAEFLQRLLEEKKRINSACENCSPGYFNQEHDLSYFVALPLVRNRIFGGFLFLGFENRQSMGTQELEFLDIFSIHAASALSRLDVINTKV